MSTRRKCELLVSVTNDALLFFCSSKPVPSTSCASNDAAQKPQLTLDPLPDDVSDTPYKIPLKLNEQSLRFDTEEFEDMEGVRLYAGSNGRVVIIHVSQRLRRILDELEEKVKEVLPPNAIYKPLHRGTEMAIPMSHYLKLFTYNDKLERKLMPLNTQVQKIGRGKFIYELCVPHVYFGPHQGGETCSINLQISAINWKPNKTTFYVNRERSLNPGASPFVNDRGDRPKGICEYGKPAMNRQDSICDYNPFRRNKKTRQHDGEIAEVEYSPLYEAM